MGTKLAGKTGGYYGDYGNGLVCNDRLAGVLAWFDPECRAGKVPDVFVKISSYRSWLRRNIDD